MFQGIFLTFKYKGVSNKKLVWGAGDTSENPEIIEMGSLKLSQKQIQKMLYQNEAE